MKVKSDSEDTNAAGIQINFGAIVKHLLLVFYPPRWSNTVQSDLHIKDVDD